MSGEKVTFGKSALIYRLSALICLICLALPAIGKPWWMRGAAGGDTDFLPPDVAFRVGARLDGQVIRIRWRIADGYYLYRRRIDVQAESPDLAVSAPKLPPGIQKFDPNLGPQEVYEQGVEATVAFSRFDAGAHPLRIKVTYQGCAEAGLCYLPITKVLEPRAVPTDAIGGGPGAVTPWQAIAIGGGALAFLLAGWARRKDRRLDTPGP